MPKQLAVGMRFFRGNFMLDTIEKLKELVVNNFGKVSIHEKDDYLEISNGKYFVDFHFVFCNDSEYCSKEFVNHLILHFSYMHRGGNWEGGGFCRVADEHDLSNEVIEFINKQLHIVEFKKTEHYEQLSLF